MQRYILIGWPESQALLEQDWFNECMLMNDENHLPNIGSSAYFVPEERYNSLIVPIIDTEDPDAQDYYGDDIPF